MEIHDADHVSDDEEGGIRFGDIYIPPPPKPACSLDSDGPRIIITEIVNENFKSYRGIRKLGPFCKCFNAIIGPNGSGKSNVIDSMLFVFGYRASKIRTKKISVLIHNSSEFQHLKQCTVSVHFAKIIDKENDKFDVISGSEVVISRTAFKDNSSFYALNGKKVHFKEIAKVLGAFGIDLNNNRFLILQGEVEQIAMMSPKALTEHETGMLEYLEDIIGTSRYREPIKTIDVRVQQLTEEKMEKSNRANMIQREVKDLKGPRDNSVAFLKTENEIINITNLLHQKHIHEYGKESKETVLKKNICDAKLKEIDDELHKISEQKSEKTKKQKESLKEWDKAKKKLEELSREFEAASNRDMALNAELLETNKRRKKIKESLKAEIVKLEELKLVPAKNEASIKECQKEIQRLAKQKEIDELALSECLAGLQGETKVLLEQKEKLEEELVGLKKVEGEAQAEFNIAESDLKHYLSSENAEQTKLEALKKTLETATSAMEEKSVRIATLKKSIPKAETDLSAAKAQLHTCKQEEGTLIADIRTKNSKLEESRVAMQATRSRGRVLDFIMQKKQEGVLPGVLGRLGDLGAIDKKYDVAISTSCGRLENIVVEDEMTGSACIDLLKKHNIGSATFIVMQKIQYVNAKMNTPFKSPLNVPRLFDLVRVEDERVKVAFYFALSDTLVATDIDQARNVAFNFGQRYRVVTFNGELIETSGTLSGGGGNPIRGRMGQTVATHTRRESNRVSGASDLGGLENAVAELQIKLTQNRELQNSLNDKIPSLTTELKTMTMELNTLQIEVKSLTQELPRIKDQVSRQERVVADTISNPERVRALETAVEKKRKPYDKAKEISGKIEQKVQTISAQINDITGGRVKSKQQKVQEVTKKIDKLTSECSKLAVAISTSQRNLKKSEDNILSFESDIKQAEERIVALNADSVQIEADGTRLLEAKEVHQKHVQELEEFHHSAKSGMDELNREENKAKIARMEIEVEVAAVDKVLSDYSNKVARSRNKLSKLSLNTIPDEDPVPLRVYTFDELEAAMSITDLTYGLALEEKKIQGKTPNLQAIRDYAEKEAQYIKRVAIVLEIVNKRNNLKSLYNDLLKKRREEFIHGFTIITSKLKELYQMITLGGDAELDLVDSMDPFHEGIVFNVRPPKKSWKSISNLSGGEKTLSSLALVFALHYYRPTPLYVMDEIDAALDFKNVSIVANYIKERTRNAQFIIISLRSNMFELSDILIGIHKIDDCTKSVRKSNRLSDTTENGPTQDDSNKENEIRQECTNLLVPDNRNGIILPTTQTTTNINQNGLCSVTSISNVQNDSSVSNVQTMSVANTQINNECSDFDALMNTDLSNGKVLKKMKNIR